MRPIKMPLTALSYVAVVLCLACTAYGSDPSDLASNADAGDGSRPVGGQREISPATFQHLLAVRSPKYNFGLGKRKYIIEDVPGKKRLPQYNFGLGKRGSFNLFDYEEEPSWNNLDYAGLVERELQEYADADSDRSTEKRMTGGQRYHFGLGKRARFDFGLGKRGDGEKRIPDRYNFGLGRR
ncbi:allatostatin-A [Uranotaenia lowii]|uniref:allatostatin-A n=1 Tax=Uranotaenia lowii TaxID=190385 RepID=UPI002478974C|nr:allatostatin-A [Uranotaenia lowii]